MKSGRPLFSKKFAQLALAFTFYAANFFSTAPTIQSAATAGPKVQGSWKMSVRALLPPHPSESGSFIRRNVGPALAFFAKAGVRGVAGPSGP